MAIGPLEPMPNNAADTNSIAVPDVMTNSATDSANTAENANAIFLMANLSPRYPPTSTNTAPARVNTATTRDYR